MGLSLRRNRRLGRLDPEGVWAERREHCWHLAGCSDAERTTCAAYFRRANCWDIWSLLAPEAKGCCRKTARCEDCYIARTRFSGNLTVYLDVESAPISTSNGAARSLPAVCIYLSQRDLETGQLVWRDQLRTVLRQLLGGDEDREAFRCLREDAGLSVGYVASVCLSHDFRKCPLIGPIIP